MNEGMKRVVAAAVEARAMALNEMASELASYASGAESDAYARAAMLFARATSEMKKARGLAAPVVVAIAMPEAA